MKKFMLIIILTLGWLGLTAQEKEIISGVVETDGYEKITKGALWTERPEAKMIYEGSYPPGFQVYTLESDYFVRFAKGENNPLDINYIVFPEGEKVYTKKGESQFYSAKCGNKIKYIRPVNTVLMKNPNDKPTEENLAGRKSFMDDSYKSPPPPVDRKFIPANKLVEEVNLNLSQVETKKKWYQTTGFKIGAGFVGVGTIGGIIWAILDHKNNGAPVGVSGHPAEKPTGVPGNG